MQMRTLICEILSQLHFRIFFTRLQMWSKPPLKNLLWAFVGSTCFLIPLVSVAVMSSLFKWNIGATAWLISPTMRCRFLGSIWFFSVFIRYDHQTPRPPRPQGFSGVPKVHSAEVMFIRQIQKLMFDVYVEHISLGFMGQGLQEVRWTQFVLLP